MTFAQVVDEVKRRKLNQLSNNFFSDTEVLEMSIDASTEIASIEGFPRRAEAVTINDGANTVPLRSDLLMLLEGQVTFESKMLRPVPYSELMSYVGRSDAPAVYHYDPKLGNTLMIAPRANRQAVINYYYTALIYPTTRPAATTNVWNGLYSQFHDLVVLRTAIKAFDMAQDYDKSAVQIERYRGRLNEFELFLGNITPEELLRRSIERGNQ